MTAPTTIPAATLPPLAYLYGEDHDPALTEPENFRPINNDWGLSKPSGGLWTAPVTKQDDGLILSTAWTEWCDENMPRAVTEPRFLPIRPNADAWVLLITGMVDLRKLVTAYPNIAEVASPVIEGEMRKHPNWSAMAVDWDAVYLTDAGQRATRMPPYGEPNLYGWDCASVLWLRPAYSVTFAAKAVAR